MNVEEQDGLQSIEILNRLVAEGRFDINELVGKQLLDPVDAKFDARQFYVAGTEITVTMRGYGGEIEFFEDDSATPSEYVRDNVEVILSNPLPPAVNRPSRLVLRQSDDAVLGVMFAGEDTKLYLVPVANLDNLGRWRSQQRSYIERNPEHDSDPSRPALRYGEAVNVGIYDFK